MKKIMSSNVFCCIRVAAKEEALWEQFKKLMATTLKKEKGCIRAHATKQISHGSIS